MAGGVRGISQEWWDRWWAEDWSWEGLADHKWQGWVVRKKGAEPEPDDQYTGSDHPNLEERFGPSARPATLQDYWRDQKDQLKVWQDANGKPVKYKGRNWRFTPLHLPFLWPDGTCSTRNTDDPLNTLDKLIENKLCNVDSRAFARGWDDKIDWRAQLQGGIFTDFEIQRLSVQKQTRTLRSKLAICCDSCAFVGLASFNSADFFGLTSFDDATFAQNAEFSEASFAGPAWFTNAAFAGSAVFSKATFSGGAWFASTTISGSAWFDASTFASRATFDSAVFAGDAFFSEAYFARDAWFEDTKFGDDGWFIDAFFGGEASFDRARFAGSAGFNKAAFRGEASFDQTNFTWDAWFIEAAFAQLSWFTDATFAKDTSFSEATFLREVWFEEAAFIGDTSFEDAQFVGPAYFNGKSASVITDSAIGTVTTDASTGNFDINFPSQPSWVSKRSFTNVSFASTLFLEEVFFDNRDFHSQTSFENSVFLRPVAFHDSKLHRGISFRSSYLRGAMNRELEPDKKLSKALTNSWHQGLRRLHAAEQKAAVGKGNDKDEPFPKFESWKQKFLKVRQEKNVEFEAKADSERSEYYGELEDCYRTLKQIMEERRDRSQEARFFKLELKARRKRRDEHVLMWERIFSDVYGAISDFGTSIIRPVIWIAGSVLTFAILYWCMGNAYSLPPTASSWGEALSYSFGRVLPFGPWAGAEPCTLPGRLMELTPPHDAPSCALQNGVDYTLRPGTPIIFQLIASAQSLFALILVFLSGLAVRRKFQIN
ncbi:pentapeptide repeat-containing protein [Henriciella litoralis]|uniref:pentapeptide repeat-containing protein n=1 Tax=Henriciella litoralis TaxID=568102 RepID=UPI000A016870|nr:pentapeptide repeat-containing protein [Henriciella litoralis]